MGDLGNVLELLHDAEPRWTTLRAVGRQWRHNARAGEAFERHLAAVDASQPPGSVVRVTASYIPDGSQPPEPDESEVDWRLWMERGGRARAEFSVGKDTVSAVFDGPTWWSWSPHTGGRTNRGATNHGHGLGPAGTMIDTAAVLSAVRLKFLGKSTLLGRDVLSVRGVPRPRRGYEPDQRLHELGVGADDYLFSIDAERGVMLRIEARFREQPFSMIEMTEVEFDADLPVETWKVVLPEGETFEDVSQRGKAYWPRRRRFLRRGWQPKGS
jgi:outer membrane lipoprotein-sorting protein